MAEIIIFPVSALGFTAFWLLMRALLKKRTPLNHWHENEDTDLLHQMKIDSTKYNKECDGKISITKRGKSQ